MRPPWKSFVVSVLLAGAAAWIACGRGSGLTDGGPPNLLLITVDTLRADRLGCYGHAAARTPNIDALARTGLRFAHAVCSVPITLPSHATIMTGLDPPEHGVRHNGTFRLAEHHRTLAETLHERGWATAAFVGAFVLDRRYGLAQGFEHYDDTVRADPAPGAMGRYNERPADEVVDAAIVWLERHLARADGRPFMVWLHLFDPHAPYEPPGEFGSLFPDSPYDGEIAFVDAQIGRLIGSLRESGVADDTLVVFTADHGEGLGEHDELTHADLIYDTTVRVPLVFSNRRLFPEEVVVRDRLAGSVDIFPTVLGLLGLDPVGGLSGRDVLASGSDAGRAIYVETLAPLLDYGWSALHGLRRIGDKYIQAPAPEYYDLQDDPAELENLYGGSPGAATELEARLARRLASWPADLEVLGLELELDADELERLASLGYVRGRERGPEIGVKDPKEMMGVWARMQRAGELSLAGRHEAAIEEIRAVLADDPSSAKAWYTAVRVYDNAQRYEEAERSLLRALALGPRAEGYVILARYALNRGDLARFEQSLEQAARLDPLDGGIHIGRGHALAMQGRWVDARREFEKAIEVDPARSGDHAREQLRRLDELQSR